MYGTPLGWDPQSRCAAVADSIDEAAEATVSKHAAKLSGEAPVRCIALHTIQRATDQGMCVIGSGKVRSKSECQDLAALAVTHALSNCSFVSNEGMELHEA